MFLFSRRSVLRFYILDQKGEEGKILFSEEKIICSNFNPELNNYYVGILFFDFSSQLFINFRLVSFQLHETSKKLFTVNH